MLNSLSQEKQNSIDTEKETQNIKTFSKEIQPLAKEVKEYKICGVNFNARNRGLPFKMALLNLPLGFQKKLSPMKSLLEL